MATDRMMANQLDRLAKNGVDLPEPMLRVMRRGGKMLLTAAQVQWVQEMLKAGLHPLYNKDYATREGKFADPYANTPEQNAYNAKDADLHKQARLSAGLVSALGAATYHCKQSAMFDRDAFRRCTFFVATAPVLVTLCQKGLIADCDFAMMICDEWHHGLVPPRYRSARERTTAASRDHIYAYLRACRWLASPARSRTGSFGLERGALIGDDDDADARAEAEAAAAMQRVPVIAHQTLGDALKAKTVAKCYLYQHDKKKHGAGTAEHIENETIKWWLREMLDGRRDHKLGLQGLVFAAKASKGKTKKAEELCDRIRRLYAEGDSTLIAGAAYGEQRPLLLPNEKCVLTGEPLRIALVMSGPGKKTANADALRTFKAGDCEVLVGDNIHATGLDVPFAKVHAELCKVHHGEEGARARQRQGARGAPRVRDAVAAGCDSAAHGPCDPDDSAEARVERLVEASLGGGDQGVPGVLGEEGRDAAWARARVHDEREQSDDRDVAAAGAGGNLLDDGYDDEDARVEPDELEEFEALDVDDLEEAADSEAAQTGSGAELVGKRIKVREGRKWFGRRRCRVWKSRHVGTPFSTSAATRSRSSCGRRTGSSSATRRRRRRRRRRRSWRRSARRWGAPSCRPPYASPARSMRTRTCAWRLRRTLRQSASWCRMRAACGASGPRSTR